MKYVIAALLIAAVICPASAQVDTTRDEMGGGRSSVLEEIQSALTDGDADALVSRCGRRVDVTMFGSSELLSRSQAKFVVMDFFRTYNPTRVILHSSEPSHGNWFASVTYWYENGETPLSIYLRMRLSDERWELREIRIAPAGEK